MNNTFFTRKIVLGMLIVLVLAFGVQSVVDADLNDPGNLTGDLQIKPLVTNQTFDFSFYISGVPGSRPDVDGSPVTEREQIKITPNGGTIVEVRMGGTSYSSLDIDSGNTFVLKEWHTDNNNGSTAGDDTPALAAGTEGDLTTGTVRVTVSPTAFGSITVTVAPIVDSIGDFEEQTFTAYAVRPPKDVQDLRFAASTPTVNPTTKTVYPPFDPNDPIYDEVVDVTLGEIGETGAGASMYAFVDFEVIEGPGSVYLDLNDDSQPDVQSDRNTSTTRTLTRWSATNNVARVRLRLNGGTNKIRATITGTVPAQTYEVLYLFQGTGTTPTPPQPPGANLTVNAPASGNAGQTITVTATTSDDRSGQLVEFTSNRGGTFALASVPTGSNGVATMQFTLPSTAGAVTITANATGYTAGTATVNVVEDVLPTLIATPGLIVEATAGQSYNIVIDAGRQGVGVLVTLSGTGFTSAQGTTLANGFATIPIVLPSTTGTYQLYASAAGYDRKLIPVTVTVGTTPTPDDPPVRLTIPSGTDRVQTVTIGSSTTLRVLVTNTRTNSPQSGVAVTFRDSSGNDLPSGTVNTGTNGEATYQWSVTSTARRLINVVITDTNVDTSGTTPVTFEITGRAQQPTQSTRLSIIRPVDGRGQMVTSGGPGATYPLTILFNNENNTPAVNQVVTLTVRNAAQVVQSSTVLITDNTGRATTPDTFRLPTAAGTYTITAVSGTQTLSVTVTVVAVRLVKNTSDSVSGDNQEGNRGEVLDDPFVVKVVQDITTTDTPVQGVAVTFTVVDGDGELSATSNATSGDTSITVRSDTNGDVRAYLVLGEDDEDNRVRASLGIPGVTDVFFDATGAVVPYEIEIVSGNNQRVTPNRYTDLMVVRVTDEDGADLQGATVTFSLRGGSGTLTPRTATTNRNGEAEAELMPREAGTYFVTASVEDVPSVRFTINVGDLADSIEIVSGNNQRGTPGSVLDDPFVVEVLDEDDDVVSGVTVTFSVTAGGGSLSATSVTTNSRGRAQTTLTLGANPGRNTVRASVSGVSTTVTFTATAGPTEPDVRLPATQRAHTYWVNTDSGTLHRLVGSNVENIASGVQNVVSLAVTNSRLYWVEKTSGNSGRIRRSDLNGSNVQLVRDLTAAPAGIAVDTNNSKIYLTNGFGKVQSINFNGSGYEPDLITNLNNPTDIAVGSGRVYWITGDNTVQSANLDGSRVLEVASGYAKLRSIAVGAGKVFWTEETGESTGKIHSANLDGSNVQELASLFATPYGISVDTTANKLYFTNSRGRIMQSSLSGGSIKIVVADLTAPGDISVPSGTTRPPGTFSRYDVNRDGVVNNTDAALVADALGESPPSNPRLDVNGDGSVNFLDLLLVFDNRENVNAAPTVAVAKLPKVSREEIQKQINLLIATDNHSLTAQHTLAYLQRLLEVVTPEKTRLLANYPNPFNPETWIPYQLATDSNVQITIYDTAGSMVRTLMLGHQAEGYYTDRSRAAYWDGRNAIGERVSSGVYFYTLTTDTFSATRKMLILK